MGHGSHMFSLYCALFVYACTAHRNEISSLVKQLLSDDVNAQRAAAVGLGAKMPVAVRTILRILYLEGQDDYRDLKLECALDEKTARKVRGIKEDLTVMQAPRLTQLEAVYILNFAGCETVAAANARVDKSDTPGMAVAGAQWKLISTLPVDELTKLVAWMVMTAPISEMQLSKARRRITA